jgi:hypothetical protein
VPDHFHGALVGFRDRRGCAGQHRPGGVFGIEHIGLAAAVAVLAVGTHHLHHIVTGPAHRRGQTTAVGTGAFDPESRRETELAGPGHQRPVSGTVRIEGGRGQQRATLIKDSSGVEVFMSVHTDNDSTARGIGWHDCHRDLSAGL